MRVREHYDWLAIEAVEQIAPEDILHTGNGLGFSLRKTVKRVGTKIKEHAKRHITVAKTAVRAVRKTERRVWKKVAPKRLHEFTSRLGKKLRKHFPTYAPWLAIAAQALNFVIPGLGVAVSFAISATSTAMKLHAAKKAEIAMKKAEEQAEREVQAELDEANKKAEEAMMSAYDKGAPYFTEAYGMTRENFQALPMEGRLKFFNIVLYDQHADLMEKIVPRDAFQKMTLEQQSNALAFMSQELEGAPTNYVPPYESPVEPQPSLAIRPEGVPFPEEAPLPEEEGEVSPPRPTLAPTAVHEASSWPLYLAGGILLVGAFFLVKAFKSK